MEFTDKVESIFFYILHYDNHQVSKELRYSEIKLMLKKSCFYKIFDKNIHLY